MLSTKLLGLRTVVYEPFYVGFNIGGFELGLDPSPERKAQGDGTSVTYWGVTNLDAALAQLISSGATPHDAAREVGERIRVGAVKDPFGNVVGLIENPAFKLDRG